MHSHPTRDAVPPDAAWIAGLYRRAFPEEDLSVLVDDLLRASDRVRSIVSEEGRHRAGHVFVTLCDVGDGPTGAVALLGPIAVEEGDRGRGHGAGLIRAAITQAGAAGAAAVLVLGDPALYGRFGFAEEDAIAPPYPIPEDWKPAWQSWMPNGRRHALQGVLRVPEPWRDPAYWSG